MTRNLKTNLWEYRAPSERSRKDVFHASLVSSGDCQQSLDSTTISLGKDFELPNFTSYSIYKSSEYFSISFDLVIDQPLFLDLFFLLLHVVLHFPFPMTLLPLLGSLSLCRLTHLFPVIDFWGSFRQELCAHFPTYSISTHSFHPYAVIYMLLSQDLLSSPNARPS